MEKEDNMKAKQINLDLSWNGSFFNENTHLSHS